MRKALLLGMALTLTGLGCNAAAGVADDDLPEVVGAGAKADGVTEPLPGTYASPRDARLTLKSDQTYRLAETAGVDVGTYELTTAGSSHYIRFAPATGAESFRYAFRVDVGQLMLREVPATEWEEWPAVEAACDVPADCGLQNLSEPRCALPPGGAWLCERSLCGFTCEPGAVPACGDGVLDPGEECDDGNTVSGDGCQADCTLPQTGVACGPATCAMGEVCCNESCGICTAPGDSCTQQICENP